MRIRMGGILAAAALALLASATPAFADGWAGADPAANFPMPYIPQSCWSPPTGDPTGPACLDWSVSVLNQARASLGQPAYELPADFDSLSPDQQLFILTNDDRTLYGLPPVPGLTPSLNQDAAGGVQTDSDPWPSTGAWMAYTSNWAGGYVNAVLAYEGWMYDDGPGSGNLDCTGNSSSGCWGHRHDVLWQFYAGGGTTAMGASAGSFSAGTPSYAMLLAQASDSGYQPSFTYTWAQAVADGAGGPGADGSGTVSGSGSGSSASSVPSSGSGPVSGEGGASGSGSGSSSGNAGSRSKSGSRGPGSGSSAHAGEPSAHAAGPGIYVQRVRVHGHRVSFRVAAADQSTLNCSLRHWKKRHWRTQRTKSCGSWTVFRYVPAGRYRLRVSSRTAALTRPGVVVR